MVKTYTIKIPPQFIIADEKIEEILNAGWKLLTIHVGIEFGHEADQPMKHYVFYKEVE